MTPSIRNIEQFDIEQIVYIMNRTSRGLSFQIEISDRNSFLALSNFWNFSYRHSYIAFVEHEAAGVLLNSVDRMEHDCFSYYLGVMPQFRGTGIYLALLRSYLDQAAREGFRRAYAETSSDSPHLLFERLHARLCHEGTQMASLPDWIPPETDQSLFPVRHISLNEFITASELDERVRYWAQRPNSLRGAGRFLRFAACADGYAAYNPRRAGTLIIDFQFQTANKEGAIAFIGQFAKIGLPLPYIFPFVPRGSALEVLLSETGFIQTRRSRSIELDLTRRKVAR